MEKTADKPTGAQTVAPKPGVRVITTPPKTAPQRVILDIKKELGDIRRMYEEELKEQGTNILIYGDFGTGKTTILETARGPVLLHSFDPGGTESIQEAINMGIVVPDTRYENEDPAHPTVWDMWEKEVDRLIQGDVLNRVGTFAIDSGTTWAQTALNKILKKAGRAGGAPYQQDYLPAMTLMENVLRKIMAQKCDFIFICHEDVTEDKTLGKMFIGPQMVGKLRQRIPLLFSELYAAVTTQTSKGIEYKLLTQATGLRKARTRIGRKGIFDTYEEPNIINLLKKANKYHRKEEPEALKIDGPVGTD